MNTFELMDSKTSSFSKTDRLIYQKIKKFPDEFAGSSVSEICENSGITKSALTRFAQKLGFSGYMEFQYQLQQDIKNSSLEKKRISKSDIYGRILKNVEESLDPLLISRLVEKMKESRAVYIYGTNLSRLPAELLMIELGFEPQILSVQPNADITPYHYSENDMIIVYSSISGNSHQGLFRQLRKDGAVRPYSVLITVNAKHPLRHNFDEMIVLPTSSMQDSASNTALSDTFAYMMFNDLIADELRITRQP